MSPQLIYQIAILLFLFSFFALMVTLFVRWFTKPVQIKFETQHVLHEPEEETGLGLASNNNNNRVRSKKVHTFLKDIIDEIENNQTSNHHHNADTIKEFWSANLSFLQSELNFDKILLFKINPNQAFKVERYFSFSFDTLQQIENRLNEKESLLKNLIMQGKNYFFSGKIGEDKLFSTLFEDSERQQFDHLYLFPLMNDQIQGIIFLIGKKGNQPLSHLHLKELVIRTNSYNKFYDATKTNP